MKSNLDLNPIFTSLGNLPNFFESSFFSSVERGSKFHLTDMLRVGWDNVEEAPNY